LESPRIHCLGAVDELGMFRPMFEADLVDNIIDVRFRGRNNAFCVVVFGYSFF